MEHFYQNIFGHFSYPHIYTHAVNQAIDNALFVEIGSFWGCSTAFMCVQIANSGKKIRFECIDPMKLLSHYVTDAANEPEKFAGYSVDQFHQRLAPVKNYYKLHQLTSDEAVTLYRDKSIDFIMIDGDHTYEAVKRDVINYLPKMKPGSLMTGDDAWAPEIAQAAKDGANEYDPTLTVNISGGHFYINIPK